MRAGSLLLNHHHFQSSLKLLVGKHELAQINRLLEADLVDFYNSLKLALALKTVKDQVTKDALAVVVAYTCSVSGNHFRRDFDRSKDAKLLLRGTTEFLYDFVFASYGDQVLRNGAVRAMPLEDTCFALWDMPCGLRSCFLAGSTAVSKIAFEEIERIFGFDHVLIQESAIHCLGLIVDEFPDDCRRLLSGAMRKHGEGHPLYDYSKLALDGL